MSGIELIKSFGEQQSKEQVQEKSKEGQDLGENKGQKLQIETQAIKQEQNQVVTQATNYLINAEQNTINLNHLDPNNQGLSAEQNSDKKLPLPLDAIKKAAEQLDNNDNQVGDEKNSKKPLPFILELQETQKELNGKNNINQQNNPNLDQNVKTTEKNPRPSIRKSMNGPGGNSRGRNGP